MGLAAHPGLTVRSDAISGSTTYDGAAHVSPLTDPEIRDRLIVLDGAAKTETMTGWRLGRSEPPYDAARRLAVHSFSCVNAATPWAGLAALDGPQDRGATMVAAFDRRPSCAHSAENIARALERVNRFLTRHAPA